MKIGLCGTMSVGKTTLVNTLKDYNTELQSFVKYVSHLDIIITKAYISDKYNYCKLLFQILYEPLSMFHKF